MLVWLGAMPGLLRSRRDIYRTIACQDEISRSHQRELGRLRFLEFYGRAIRLIPAVVHCL